jgi:hypothetical protein
MLGYDFPVYQSTVISTVNCESVPFGLLLLHVDAPEEMVNPLTTAHPLETSGIYLPLFRSGSRVSYQGNLCTVSHTQLCGRTGRGHSLQH